VLYALDSDAWMDYFESIAAHDGPLLASVRLLPSRGGPGSPETAPRTQALRAMRYQRERDVLEVATGGTPTHPALRYFISGPRRILIEESEAAREIVVEDSTRRRTAISVRTVARPAGTPLPAAHAAAAAPR
jgi:hypothetical protein